MVVSSTELKADDCSATKSIWITWERQLRNRSLAVRLGIPLIEVNLPKIRVPRYLLGIIKTTWVLFKFKPDLVVSQNPSIILCVLLLILKPIMRYKLVIDAHYGGVIAYNGSNLFQRLIDFCNRHADLVIVTNLNHANLVRAVGGEPFICQDPLPELGQYEHEKSDEEGRRILFISSFDTDEPYNIMLEVGELLHAEGFVVQISGNYKKVGINPEQFPSVELLGFVSESIFYTCLMRSHVVVDLTTNQDCLVCGAYEAVEAGVPMVLSDNIAQREYFTGGVVFSDNTTNNTFESVKEVYANREQLISELSNWRSKAIQDMDVKLLEFSKILDL